MYEELNNYLELNKKRIKNAHNLIEEIQEDVAKKNKIIDLMAEYIRTNTNLEKEIRTSIGYMGEENVLAGIKKYFNNRVGDIE